MTKRIFVLIAVAAVCNRAISQSCTTDQSKFNQLMAWYNANKGSKPAIPVPPQITPDCTQCSDLIPNNHNQKIVDAFNKKSAEPEATYISTVLAIAKDKLIAHTGGNIFPGDHYPNNSDPCWNKIPDSQLQTLLNFLESRLSTKAAGMLEKYSGNGDYFLGGIQFYFGIQRQLALLGWVADADNPLVKTWATNYYLKYQNKLFQQYQYQLYPGIMYLPRDMAIITGWNTPLIKVPSQSGTDAYADEGVLVINKAIAFMHFKLNFKLDASGHGQNGAQIRCTISGQKEIWCQVTKNKNGESCYQWLGDDDGNNMKLKVEQMTFENSKGKMTYDGPTEFEDAMQVSVGLCEASPQFTLNFTSFGPKKETYSVKTDNGPQDITASIIPTLFSSITGDESISKFQKLEGREDELTALAQRAGAHANDPKYWNTAQGKKDKAELQELQSQFGTIGPGAQGRATSMTAALSGITAPFQLGSSMPVNKTINAKLMTQKSGWDYGKITITLQETPDTRDNAKF